MLEQAVINTFWTCEIPLLFKNLFSFQTFFQSKIFFFTKMLKLLLQNSAKEKKMQPKFKISKPRSFFYPLTDTQILMDFRTITRTLDPIYLWKAAVKIRCMPIKNYKLLHDPKGLLSQSSKEEAIHRFHSNREQKEHWKFQYIFALFSSINSSYFP